MVGRFYALILLGFALLRTLAMRLFGHGKPLVSFEQQYGREGLLKVGTSEAELLKEPGRCTACGRCDRAEFARIAASKVGYRGLMHFVLSGVRSMPDYSLVATQLSEVPDEALRQAESACPVHVPLASLVHLVRSHAERHPTN